MTLAAPPTFAAAPASRVGAIRPVSRQAKGAKAKKKPKEQEAHRPAAVRLRVRHTGAANRIFVFRLRSPSSVAAPPTSASGTACRSRAPTPAGLGPKGALTSPSGTQCGKGPVARRRTPCTPGASPRTTSVTRRLPTRVSRKVRSVRGRSKASSPAVGSNRKSRSRPYLRERVESRTSQRVRSR